MIRAVLRPSTHVDVIAQDEAAQYTKQLSLKHCSSPRGLWGLLQTASNSFCAFQVPLKHKRVKWITCELYFVPLVDTVILKNKSSLPVVVSGHESSPFEINPGTFHTLYTGSWALGAADDTVADLYILPTLYSIVTRTTEGIRKTRKRAHDDEDGLCSELVVSVRNEPVTAVQLGNLPVDQTVSISASGEAYTICKSRQIASTSLSGVFSATHSKLGCIVVKYVRPGRPGYQGHPAQLVVRAANNWLQESRLQRQLDHEAVVRSLGADARFFYIFQEMAEGYDLGSTRWKDLSSHMFIGTDDEADLIVKGTISAVKYMHDQNIVHGDIKPRNLLFKPLKVCDFGHSHEPGGWQGGSPRYIGPELLVGSDMMGKHTDIFALGVTALYVYKKCPLPESRKDWIIADTHDITSPDKQQAAQKAMISWLNEVAEYRSKLNDKTDPHCLIRDMTDPNFTSRPSAEELERRCRSVSTANAPGPADTKNQDVQTHAASPYHGSTTQEDSQDPFELYKKKEALRR